MGIDQTLQLRAHEIINNSVEAITAREALKRALTERFPDYNSLIEAAATIGASTMRSMRKSTYQLPDGQGELFDIPAVIANRTEQGDLFIHRSHATYGQVRQWIKEARQHHSTQSLRFDRAEKELEAAGEVDDDELWVEFRALVVGGGDYSAEVES